jgi:hypothetical protein
MDQWKAEFPKESGLPSAEDLYGTIKGNFNTLRTLTFIKSEEEKKLGIGEDFPYGPIPFGTCIHYPYFAANGDVEIY